MNEKGQGVIDHLIIISGTKFCADQNMAYDYFNVSCNSYNYNDSINYDYICFGENCTTQVQNCDDSNLVQFKENYKLKSKCKKCGE